MSYDMTDGGVAAYHRLQLEGREKLSVSGVEDVVRFDENCIVTTTSAGTLIITGEELHIGKLSLDGGEMQVDGRIDAVTYEDTEVRQGSFLSSRSVCPVTPRPPRRWAPPPPCATTCCAQCGFAAAGTAALPVRWTRCISPGRACFCCGSPCASDRESCGSTCLRAWLWGLCCTA